MMRSFCIFLCLLIMVSAQNQVADVQTGSMQVEANWIQEGPEYRAPSSPCLCSEGTCSCCTGFLLGQLGFNLRQRGCVNVTYDPDDFTFTTALVVNDRVLYKNRFSGKNPDPMCVKIPRTEIKFCAVFSNVYFAGRNIHMCIRMESRWAGTSLFQVSLDCIRMGADGVAVLKPEDGGGIPNTVFEPDDELDDYDDVGDGDGDDDDDDEVL